MQGGGGGQMEQQRREEDLRGSGACAGNILGSGVHEMPFPAFWGVILQNSEDHRTS